MNTRMCIHVYMRIYIKSMKFGDPTIVIQDTYVIYVYMYMYTHI
jgi:hypothetical protein